MFAGKRTRIVDQFYVSKRCNTLEQLAEYMQGLRDHGRTIDGKIVEWKAVFISQVSTVNYSATWRDPLFQAFMWITVEQEEASTEYALVPPTDANSSA